MTLVKMGLSHPEQTVLVAAEFPANCPILLSPLGPAPRLEVWPRVGTARASRLVSKWTSPTSGRQRHRCQVTQPPTQRDETSTRM